MITDATSLFRLKLGPLPLSLIEGRPTPFGAEKFLLVGKTRAFGCL